MFGITLETIVLAFAGGAFGAAVGGLNSFILTGIATIISVAIAMAGGADGGDWANLVNWGFLFAPAIAFQGGAAAVAYAKKKGLVENGQDIAKALWGLNAPDVLAVGGLFGILGHIGIQLTSQLPAINGHGFTDGNAFPIFIIACIVRLVFGETGVTGKVAAGGNRFASATSPLSHILISVAVGLPFAYFVRENPNLFLLSFGVTAFWLIFLRLGDAFPVAHHIALPAQIATLYSGSLFWGLAFALMGSYLGEISGALFNNHADTHTDPPAVTIFILTTLAAIIAPVMTSTGDLVGIIVSVVVAAAGYFYSTTVAKAKVM
ncbi:MAG: hypothetical protein JW981_03265 [Anaerolineae bacterium]|nr:hypothetical protein [Anaerolineae bacterium]